MLKHSETLHSTVEGRSTNKESSEQWSMVVEAAQIYQILSSISAEQLAEIKKAIPAINAEFVSKNHN